MAALIVRIRRLLVWLAGDCDCKIYDMGIGSLVIRGFWYVDFLGSGFLWGGY